jgi:hypothetical protein
MAAVNDNIVKAAHRHIMPQPQPAATLAQDKTPNLAARAAPGVACPVWNT